MSNNPKTIVNKYHFKIKKALGQNFIADEKVISRLVTLAQIDKETVVVEIGPGLGILTEALAEKAKQVVAYEIDESLKPILTETLANLSNVQVIYQDFLKADLNFLNEYSKVMVVANLPYYITTPIITKLITSGIKFDKLVIMVQKEVGERFKAKPGSKTYGSLTVFLNYYFDIKSLMMVNKEVFIPKPKVDSVVLELKTKQPLALKNQALFDQLVKASFKQKRKLLSNNLKAYDLDVINQVLLERGYDLKVRAEAIDVETFVMMANELSDQNDK